jgi:hypothetical protein
MRYGYSNFLNGQPSNNTKLNKIHSAKVISVVLDESHPRFTALGGWTALGAIEYDFVTDSSYTGEYPVAYPLHSNIKHFPLPNEVVEITSALSNAEDNYAKNDKMTAGIHRKYYTTVVNVWNHPHQNAYSFFMNSTPPIQNKDYEQTQNGNTSVKISTPVDINLGSTFKERNVSPLLPFEGDIIYEGRWGNSIRLGSTVKSGLGFIFGRRSVYDNNWSTSGTNGDPIFIIKNSTRYNLSGSSYPIIEDINKDESSIYLTSTQNVPINVARADYTSYDNSGYSPPSNPKEYKGSQILLNSGRLVFNAKSDHILLSAGGSINLNTPSSVNIDTRKVLIQSDNIYLGGENDSMQPLMLGDKTVNLLQNILDNLITLTDKLANLKSDNIVDLGEPAEFTELGIAALAINDQLKSIKDNLNTPNYLTSKANYTV